MTRARIPLTRTKAAHMPPVCIICGQPVDSHVAHMFTWRPSFLSVGFWFSVVLCLPLAIVLSVVNFVNTRRATVECPVCVRHRGHWAWRSFWTYAPLFAITIIDLTVGGLLFVRVLPDEAFAYMFLGTAAMLMTWAVIAAIVQRGGVRAEEINYDDIVLVGVHPMFADLLRVERKRHKAAPDFGWEDYDPYPRRPLGDASRSRP